MQSKQMDKDNNQAKSIDNERHFWTREYSLKRWAFLLVTTVIFVGLVLPLFAEIVVGIIWPDKVKGIEVWNQFSSVILGIVATVLSIVSMFMGFKSYEDSSNLTTLCMQSFDHIQNVEKEFNLIKSDLFQIVIKQMKAPNSWSPDNVPEKP